MHNEAPAHTSSPGNQLTRHTLCVRPTPGRNAASREAACRSEPCRSEPCPPSTPPCTPSARHTHTQPELKAALRDGGAAIPYLRTPPPARDSTPPPSIFALALHSPAYPPAMALRSFDQADRAKFLQFVTGTSKVPLQGFAALEGMNGIQKFQIHRDDRSTDRLPSAHTW